MKKINCFMIFMLILLSIVSCVSAYDSGSIAQGIRSSKQQQPETPVQTVPDVPSYTTFPVTASRRKGSLTLDSVKWLGESAEDMNQMFSAFSGLRADYSSQTGDTPMSSFGLSLGQYPILSYAVQNTTPKFISSNLLGNETYMIYDEDRFAENLIDAVYRMVENTGGSVEDLPDINEAYAIVQALREGKVNIVPDTMASMSLTQEIDSSSLQPIMMNIMMRFAEAEPTEKYGYYFTDWNEYDLEFSWPDAEDLPAFEEPVSAMGGTFTQADILMILDALPKFLADNPELAEILNQSIRTSFEKFNPASAGMGDADMLPQLIDSLKQSVETNMKDFSILFKMDQGKYGEPVLFTLDLKSQTEAGESDMVIIFHMANDEKGSAFEAAVDMVMGEMSIPFLRALVVSPPDAANDASNLTINLRFDDQNGGAFEYAQQTESYLASTMTQVSDTNINFDFSGERGTMEIFSTAIPNEFDGKDTSTQVTYTHISQGTPLFTASVSVEGKNEEPVAGLTAEDAVAASQLSESDYDQIATNFFNQIIMLMSGFM